MNFNVFIKLVDFKNGAWWPSYESNDTLQFKTEIKIHMRPAFVFIRRSNDIHNYSDSLLLFINDYFDTMMWKSHANDSPPKLSSSTQPFQIRKIE